MVDLIDSAAVRGSERAQCEQGEIIQMWSVFWLLHAMWMVHGWLLLSKSAEK